MVEDLTKWLVGLDDLLDGIPTICSWGSGAHNGSCYNLAGQAVSNPCHGIFIMKDKKKVVK